MNKVLDEENLSWVIIFTSLTFLTAYLIHRFIYLICVPFVFLFVLSMAAPSHESQMKQKEETPKEFIEEFDHL